METQRIPLAMKKIQTILMLAALPMTLSAQHFTVAVTNPLPEQRQELVELDASDIKKKLGIESNETFIVTNMSGQQMPYQLTHDGKLLVETPVKPKGTAKFSIEKGIPQSFTTFVAGQLYTIRKDDIAWENDRGAYRLYGPALQQSGERSFGIDVWSKNTPYIDVPQRYYKDLEGLVQIEANRQNGVTDPTVRQTHSFHLDHGTGLDLYTVGPTLGCGTPALMDKGDLVLPYCYKNYKILDNGPLRFTVELTYTPTVIDKDTITEHRIITLDKGSNFNKMTVWYDGLRKPRDLAAGVVIHKAAPDDMIIGKNYVQYADPTDKPDVQYYTLFVAAVFPNGAETKFLKMKKEEADAVGHAIGIKKDLKSGERYTYYFGSAWSCYDVRTQREWQCRIDELLNGLQHPLIVNVQ